MLSFQIREIKPEDNAAVAKVIRKVMKEFGAVGDGYSINDPEVDQMYEAYNKEGHIFYVVENEGNKKILGCGGIAPLKEGAPDMCELQKMYFLPALRGYKMGQRLLDLCLGQAIFMEYKTCYLETCKRMKAANALYKKNGFKILKEALGCTGHGGCDSFFQKTL